LGSIILELVYLWVEDYKNIKKQGFNFSPRFTCNYDEDSNELTIDENEDYIENFFGDNINVTAIVGKNGSGKSSLLELISNYEDFRFFERKNFFIIYKKDEKLYGIYSLKSPPKNYIQNINFSHHKEWVKRFNSGDNNWHLGTYNIAPSKPIGGSITYKRLNGSFHSSTIENSNSYYLSDNQFFIHKYVAIYRGHKDIINKLTSICTFDTLRIKLKYRSIQIFDNYQAHTDDVKNILQKTKAIMSKFSEEQRVAENKYPHSPEYYKNYQRILAPSLFIAVLDYFFSDHHNVDSQCFSDLLKELILLEGRINNSQSDFIIHTEIYTFISNLKNIIQKTFKDEKNLFKAIDFLIKLSDTRQYNDVFYCDFDLNKMDIDTVNVINILAGIFDDNDKSLENGTSLRIIELDLINSKTQAEYGIISDGEKQFLKVTIDFFTQLPYVGKMTNNKSHIFLSDEIDESLHPTWKKKLISHLLDILKIYTDENENIFLHFFFTTHSPFLLSDIPKQNIIFQDKDQNENCKVVDGLKEKKQTFGANIHTLLSDSFFMEDGLMGEFAKEKIDKAIKLLNQEKLDEDELKYCEQIISIVGEPIVKKQLQRMLDSKRLKKVDEIDKIKETMEDLQIRLDELENG